MRREPRRWPASGRDLWCIVAFEMLKRDAHSDMVFVPYPGPAGAVNALLGNQVTSYFGNYTDVSAHLASGQLRALAVATPERIAPLPGVPTVAESIHKSYAGERLVWIVCTRRKLPARPLDKSAIGLSRRCKDAEVRKKLESRWSLPGEVHVDRRFGALIQRQSDLYGQVIRERHITLN